MKNIRNIIFDLGGVVISLDRNRAVRALEKLGMSDVDSLLDLYEQRGPFLLLETGKIDTAELFDLLLPECKPGTTATQLRDAFESFLIEIPSVRLETIMRLREKGYRIFVLSNTNPLMYNHWIAREFQRDGLTINDYFDGIVTSFEEGICKPDPEIFRKLTRRYGLDPQETLMLDDSADNCRAAESVGLNVLQVMPSGKNSFEDICQQLLNKTDNE